MTKPKILVFTDYYLPGFKAGGVLRTLVSLVNGLSEQLDFLICTRDRDCGDFKAYSNLAVNKWTNIKSGVEIFYTESRLRSLPVFIKLMRNSGSDAIYLTSFFSPYFTVLPILLIRLGLCKCPVVIVAPRGELSSNCLSSKWFKKNFFLKAVIFFGLYENLIWHASSSKEVQEIKLILGKIANDIRLAPDIVDYDLDNVNSKKNKKSGYIRLIFLSRISPVKNLTYLLSVLKECKKNINLDIYGPIENSDYWDDCKKLIASLPSNVSASYCGSIKPDDVIATFGRYDLFVFPTLGESFGHVILESLCAATPVLISDQTPWAGSSYLGVEVLRLDKNDWVATIDSWADLTQLEYVKRSCDARSYFEIHQDQSDALLKNKELFLSSISRLY